MNKDNEYTRMNIELKSIAKTIQDNNGKEKNFDNVDYIVDIGLSVNNNFSNKNSSNYMQYETVYAKNNYKKHAEYSSLDNYYANKRIKEHARSENSFETENSRPKKQCINKYAKEHSRFKEYNAGKNFDEIFEEHSSGTLNNRIAEYGPRNSLNKPINCVNTKKRAYSRTPTEDINIDEFNEYRAYNISHLPKHRLCKNENEKSGKIRTKNDIWMNCVKDELRSNSLILNESEIESSLYLKNSKNSSSGFKHSVQNKIANNYNSLLMNFNQKHNEKSYDAFKYNINDYEYSPCNNSYNNKYSSNIRYIHNNNGILNNTKFSTVNEQDNIMTDKNLYENSRINKENMLSALRKEDIWNRRRNSNHHVSDNNISNNNYSLNSNSNNNDYYRNNRINRGKYDTKIINSKCNSNSNNINNCITKNTPNIDNVKLVRNTTRSDIYDKYNNLMPNNNITNFLFCSSKNIRSRSTSYKYKDITNIIDLKRSKSVPCSFKNDSTSNINTSNSAFKQSLTILRSSQNNLQPSYNRINNKSINTSNINKNFNPRNNSTIKYTNINDINNLSEKIVSYSDISDAHRNQLCCSPTESLLYSKRIYAKSTLNKDNNYRSENISTNFNDIPLHKTDAFYHRDIITPEIHINNKLLNTNKYNRNNSIKFNSIDNDPFDQNNNIKSYSQHLNSIDKLDHNAYTSNSKSNYIKNIHNKFDNSNNENLKSECTNEKFKSNMEIAQQEIMNIIQCKYPELRTRSFSETDKSGSITGSYTNLVTKKRKNKIEKLNNERKASINTQNIESNSIQSNSDSETAKLVKLNKGTWSKEEDDKLKKLIEQYEPKNWTFIAKKLGTRAGKQCRERWHNHLHPSITKRPFTALEDLIIYHLHQEIGNKWSEMSLYLPGRTDNAIKNHWNSSLSKKIKRSMSLSDIQRQIEKSGIVNMCVKKTKKCCCMKCIKELRSKRSKSVNDRNLNNSLENLDKIDETNNITELNINQNNATENNIYTNNLDIAVVDNNLKNNNNNRITNSNNLDKNNKKEPDIVDEFNTNNLRNAYDNSLNNSQINNVNNVNAIPTDYNNSAYDSKKFNEVIYTNIDNNENNMKYNCSFDSNTKYSSNNRKIQYKTDKKLINNTKHSEFNVIKKNSQSYNNHKIHNKESHVIDKEDEELASLALLELFKNL
ncbi:hypothetical protein EDEG_03732 [Edhazardia aedis USNM 41457]|uniref:Uncharacterized protein n=1 Tax=Edhazardia aedis (strain USNM 41457) TaxID=1003232 RepID=J9D1N3_EDHAE|nr:hypothetical protein EDEG_03732 [Edhazardia aedis USNM 41457]|eukprot:EJW01751.1 hypothetical protein EDEG_03732 [Edhazardia aedis USNM 41457]